LFGRNRQTPYNHLLVLPLLLFNFQVSILVLSFSFIFGRAKPSPSNARHSPFPGRVLSGPSNELDQVSARFSFVDVSPFKLEAVLAFSFAPRAFCVFCWLLSETLVLSRSPCFRFIFSTLWDLKLIVVLRYVFFPAFFTMCRDA
jgi:hypothetical protein